MRHSSFSSPLPINPISALVLIITALVVFQKTISFTSPLSQQDMVENPARLLVLGADRSISMEGVMVIDTAYIRTLTNHYLNTGQALVLIADAIAGPTRQPLLRLSIKAPKSLKNLSLSKHAAAVEANRKILQNNKRIIDNFIRQFQFRIAAADLRAIDTDLSGFLLRVKNCLGEPQFMEYEKIIFIQSDGKQSVRVTKNNTTFTDTRLVVPDFGAGVRFTVCNWEHPENVAQIEQVFESPDGLIPFLTQ